MEVHRSAGDGCGRTEQLGDGEEQCRLAAPRLADDAKELAALHIEVDVVDGAHRATTGSVRNGKVAHLQNWFDHLSAPSAAPDC